MLPHVPTRARHGVIATLVLALTVSIPAACGDRGDAPPDTPADTAATAAEPDEDEAPAGPERIYYDLTRFEWYARGQPLMHDGRAYAAGPDAVEADASTMQRIGEYGGVDVYAREGVSADSVVFVPVFERFWQPFVLTSNTQIGPDTASVASARARGGESRARAVSFTGRVWPAR